MITLQKLMDSISSPGSVTLVYGNRGGGKSHASVYISEILAKQKIPGLPPVEILTNMFFIRRPAQKTFEECVPPGVHHVSSLKEALKTIVDIRREEKGVRRRFLLVLDEAQNFLPPNDNDVSRSMKIFMGSIRKFDLAIFLLCPSPRTLGPSFRNLLTDPYPGNLTCIMHKDLGLNDRFIKSRGLKWSPRELICVQDYSMEAPALLRITTSEWTKRKEDLKVGGEEACYDTFACAAFEVGEGFDWNDFNRTISGVSSLNVQKVMEAYFDNMEEAQGGQDPPAEVSREYKVEMILRTVKQLDVPLKQACDLKLWFVVLQ